MNKKVDTAVTPEDIRVYAQKRGVCLWTRWLCGDVVFWPTDDTKTYGPLVNTGLSQGETLPRDSFPAVGPAGVRA